MKTEILNYVIYENIPCDNYLSVAKFVQLIQFYGTHGLFSRTIVIFLLN